MFNYPLAMKSCRDWTNNVSPITMLNFCELALILKGLDLLLHGHSLFLDIGFVKVRLVKSSL